MATLHARGNVPFLDARRSVVYRQGHIARARAFPVWEADIDERIKALALEGLDTSAPIVVYCSGGDCKDFHMLAEKLHMVGFDNVLVYKDGFPDWQKRGLPVEEGRRALSGRLTLALADGARPVRARGDLRRRGVRQDRGSAGVRPRDPQLQAACPASP